MDRSEINFADLPDYLALDFGRFSLDPLMDPTTLPTESSLPDRDHDPQAESSYPQLPQPDNTPQPAKTDSASFASGPTSHTSLAPAPGSQTESQAESPPYHTQLEQDDHDEDFLRAVQLSKKTLREDEQRRQRWHHQVAEPTNIRQPVATSSHFKRRHDSSSDDASKEGALRREMPAHTVGESDSWHATALYDFKAQKPNEMDLFAGDYITNIEIISADWMVGVNHRGQRGSFPKSLVCLTAAAAAAFGLPGPSSPTRGFHRGRRPRSPTAKTRRIPRRSSSSTTPPTLFESRTLGGGRHHGDELLRAPRPAKSTTPGKVQPSETPIIVVQQAEASDSSIRRDPSYRDLANEAFVPHPPKVDKSIATRADPDQSEHLLNTSLSVRDSIYSSGSNEEGPFLPSSLQVPNNSRDRFSSDQSSRPKIRDTSRSRTVSGIVTEAGEKETHTCRFCRRRGLEIWYCDGCRANFCEPCWDRLPLHEPQEDDRADDSHEKTNVRLANKVRAILAPRHSPEDREQLHLNDTDTSWFGVVREDDSPLPLFRNYGRYADLIMTLKETRLDLPPLSGTSADDSDILYPGLAAFVGQTGAGKSTLIKLLIDLGTKPDDPAFPTPVVGAAGASNPTSEDVHLYLDPASSMSSSSRAPLLFADGEGLRGGEQDPAGFLLRKMREKQARHDRAARPLKHTSEREVLWATTSTKKSRSFAVANLYPRLLYTFSDVIVFVEQNQRTLEEVIQRLVEWADAALEKSSNQPVLPHAIIALNQSRHDIDPSLWDVNKATSVHLGSVSLDLGKHPVFKKHVESWNERGREISTVEQLIRSYYSSIRVVHIPAYGKTGLILQQVQKLYDEIHRASQLAREQKANLRMLLDADDFQPYLEQAFDHFAQDLNMPFDFVQASLASSPIPHDFGGNILKLAIQVMACWEDKAKGQHIFEELSTVVASCIMLDATRSRIKGSPEEIFSSRYLEHIDNALENFCNLHWPCEYRDENRGRCVNVRSGHGTKGHQLKDGRMISADGHYQSDFSFESYRDTFQKHVYSKLVALSRMVRDRTREIGIEEKAAAEVHRDRVLPTFIERASHNNPKAFISHTVCFVCLFEPPEHALPCGHIICTSCLRLYGNPVPNRYVEIARCPMEKAEQHFREAWKVRLKPASCGVRVLSLDGGGTRGIVELEILRQIEEEFGSGISVQSFFDLIVGTSTGGIIALGLTARNWPLGDCAQQFKAFCKQAFTLRKGANMPFVGRFVENYYHSKYETKPLEDSLISAFTDQQYLFGGGREKAGSLDIKVAVTATSSAGTSVVLANYNRLCFEKLTYHFQRPEQLKGEVKTWEAARATSAAPFYFKPLHHEPSRQVFSDGGIYHNNPIKIADQERKLIWPDQQHADPDILISIGTGFCSKSEKEADKSAIRWRPEAKGILAHLIFLANLGKDHIHWSLRSENTWTEFIATKSSSSKERYIRINPELEKPLPKLDDVSQLDSLRSTTETFARSSNRIMIREVTQRLVAACFYLDLEERPVWDPYTEHLEVTGNIRCRFTENHEIEALGKYLKRHATNGRVPCFVIEGSDVNHANHTPVPISKGVINRMLNDNIFGLGRQLTIRRSNQQAVTTISLCLTEGQAFPISGFPRQLKNRSTGFSMNRSTVNASESFRWKGRTASFRDRRSDWRPSPNWSQAQYKEAQNSIERYADAENPYLLGRATEDDLMPTGPGTHGATAPPDLLSRASSFSLGAEARHQPKLRRSRTHAGFGNTAASSAIAAADVARDSGALADANEPESQPQLKRSVTLASMEEGDEASDNQEASYFIARDDRHARSDDELSLRQYDIVRVTQMTQGWWRGHRSPSEREGWMPSNFLIPANQHASEVFLQQQPSSSLDGLRRAARRVFNKVPGRRRVPRDSSMDSPGGTTLEIHPWDDEVVKSEAFESEAVFEYYAPKGPIELDAVDHPLPELDGRGVLGGVERRDFHFHPHPVQRHELSAGSIRRANDQARSEISPLTRDEQLRGSSNSAVSPIPFSAAIPAGSTETTTSMSSVSDPVPMSELLLD